MFDRRGFLKFACGAGAGIVASPIIWKGLDDLSIWTQNWPWIPNPGGGEPSAIPTISKFCPSGQGIIVRLLGDRPVTVHGDPNHPLSLGGLNALAAAEVQLMHSPARLRAPHKLTPTGGHVAISWEEAAEILHQGLQKNKAKGIFALSGDPTSVVNDILSAITNKSGGKCFIMPGEEQPARLAWKIMCGHNPSASPTSDIGRLGYDMEHSDMIFAIGAGVLESWGPITRNRKAWSRGRPTGKEATVSLAYAGPVLDSTATGADWWLPMQNGCELAVALGLAHLLIKFGRGANLPDFADFSALCAEYTPAHVEEISSVPANLLEEVASAMLKAKHPLVIVGSALNQGGGAAPILAGLACNILLGNLNRQGGIRILPHLPASLSGASSLDKLLDNDFMTYTGKDENPGVFIFYEANPVYALPGGAKSIFERAEFTVAFTSFMDETASECDLVLPGATGLERYDDADSPYGVGRLTYSLAVPVCAPNYEARSAADILLAAGRDFGFIDKKFSEVSDLLRIRIANMGADWANLASGTAYISDSIITPQNINFGASVLAQAAGGLQKNKEISLAPLMRHGVGTAETGISPYAVKLLGPQEVWRKKSVVHMNGATARILGLAEGNLVRMAGSGSGGSAYILAYVLIDEAVSAGSVSLLLGLGHTGFDMFSQDKGSNLLDLTVPDIEAGTGLAVWNNISVTLAKV